MYAVEQDLNGIANINPYRYRSYYYDTETGMYYLQSRYYNPNVGRFVNGDFPEIVDYFYGCLLTNQFIYCFNELICLKDNDGYWPERLIKKLVGNATWKDLNSAERKLVCKYPYQARSVKHAREQTEKWGILLYKGAWAFDDNEANAFRHAFWSASITYLIGARYAKLFTDAHEYGQTSKSSRMDLKNNSTGIRLGEWYISQRKVWTTKAKNKNKHPKKYFYYKFKKIYFTADPYNNIATIIYDAAQKGVLTWLR